MEASQKILLNAAEKALCEKSFYQFFKIGWRYSDPAKFVDDWHIKVLCDALQGVFEGKTTRLIINIPPRCSKSTIICVFFPVWCWIKDPTKKLLTGSHTRDLATRDTVKSRYLMQSSWFRNLWGNAFNLSSDQNQKTYYTNTDMGARYCFSVGGGITGTGADYILLDDPLDSSSGNSKKKRETANQWFDEALSTRLNSQKLGAIVVIMQRLHSKDLTGYLLSKSKEWDHICLPMRFESKSRYDKRKKKGQILSKRFSEKNLKKYEKSVGRYAVASQLQQRPSPREGGIIKCDWIEEYTVLPSKVLSYEWSWDSAIKTGKNNDYTVGTYWAECDSGYYMVDMFRKKVEYPEFKKRLESLYYKHVSNAILVEDKSSGQQLIQEYKRRTRLPIIGMMPGRDMLSSKEERLTQVSDLFESGIVKFPKNAPWLEDVIDELTSFPKADHDDIVDSISQYLSRRIRKMRNSKPVPNDIQDDLKTKSNSLDW